jgi:tripartite-type tricarboxylate transporter receptor subunit TctC
MIATRRRLLQWAGTGMAAAGLPRVGAAAEERYPVKPIQVVVPFAPGGSGDAATRLIQQGVSELLGQPLVIINRPGAGTNIGMQAVARARPDGYTLLMAATGLTVNKALFDNLTFDPMAELAPVSNVLNSPIFLAINPSVPATNLQELLAYIRGHAGEINYSTSGVGSSSHIGAELFAQVTGTQMQHIPFSGGGASIAGAVSNSGVQLIFSNVVTLSGVVRAGALRAIGIASAERLPAMPEVPTFLEQGVDFQCGGWFGLCAPARTPEPIIERLSLAVQQVMRRPEVRKLAYDQGGEPIGDTPEQFRRFLDQEAARLQTLIRTAGIRG